MAWYAAVDVRAYQLCDSAFSVAIDSSTGGKFAQAQEACKRQLACEIAAESSPAAPSEAYRYVGTTNNIISLHNPLSS